MLNLNPTVEIKFINQELYGAKIKPGTGGDTGVPVEYLERAQLAPATDGSAGYDLRADIAEPIAVYPGQTVAVGAGIALDLMWNHIAMLLLPRSGLGANKGIVLGNLTGLIDSDYQGEVIISVWNRNCDGTKPFIIEPKTKICQAIFPILAHPSFVDVEEFTRSTARGAGGFNSTGLQ